MAIDPEKQEAEQEVIREEQAVELEANDGDWDTSITQNDGI